MIDAVILVCRGFSHKAFQPLLEFRVLPTYPLFLNINHAGVHSSMLDAVILVRRGFSHKALQPLLEFTLACLMQ